MALELRDGRNEMSLEDKQNELMWKAKRDALLQQDYSSFLRERGLLAGPEARSRSPWIDTGEDSTRAWKHGISS